MATIKRERDSIHGISGGGVRTPNSRSYIYNMEDTEDSRNYLTIECKVRKVIQWLQRRCVHFLCLYGHEECALAILMLNLSNLSYLVMYKFLVRYSADLMTIDHVKVQEFISKVIEDDKLTTLKGPPDMTPFLGLPVPECEAAKESEES